MAKVTCKSFVETCFFCRYLYTQQRWEPFEKMIHVNDDDRSAVMYSLIDLLKGSAGIKGSPLIIDVTYAETGIIEISPNEGVIESTLLQYFSDTLLVRVHHDSEAQFILSSDYCHDKFPIGAPIVYVLTDDELEIMRLSEVPEKLFLSKVPYPACIILRYGRISLIHVDSVVNLSMLSIDDFEDLF